MSASVRLEIATCVRDIAKCARESAKCARDIAKCARETDATPIRCGPAQVNHLGLRTCAWTQRLKTLARTRTRQTPRRTVMGPQHSEALRSSVDAGTYT